MHRALLVNLWNVLFIMQGAAAAGIPVTQPAVPAVPTPEQAAWCDLEIGLMIHIGPSTWED